ncbi:carbohydrate binding family 9 domain-containing protein [Flavobacterium sp. N3904]|uniref:carbohydrate binding family 9 domain-containing protein n=1 Tax=Flavobacterium sp. N3904 TaxID=2986835 RepID=UPI002225400A|nr:carbohydrate binding family 9 domain-containing protein [Flavobacterium sp. N3904]
MTKYCLLIAFFIVIGSSVLYGQKKVLQAKSITEKITIDGNLDEQVWKTANVATDFIMYTPDNGKLINEDKKTDVKILYDNDAVYISAVMYDNDPSKIQKEITHRDVLGVDDYFSVSINGFNDGQQDFRFFVTAAGVQLDCIALEDSEDFTWDAIWFSKATLTDFGWVVEIKLPYAALRFPKEKKQTWGINFMRNIERDVQKYTWNRVNNEVHAVIAQEGILEGIENIKPPTRLFFIPYSSYYYQKDDYNSDQTFKAGLDIKYGINDSFTLDLILVPDFGQTKFDNAILNLDPFEQQLDENRPFFTEGTNLFTKGNLFYSRRIGGFPSTIPEIADNEEFVEFPSSVDLINAIKLTGRTDKDLGIGFLNAITEKTYATIENTDTGETRKEVVEPLTNYNVIVLNQRFNKNSSVSFVNTNTLRNGSFRDANVSAVLFDLNTTKNTYTLNGDFKYSTVKTVEDYDGFKTALNFEKTSGKFRYGLSAKYLSENYDTNDLGILYVNNYKNAYGSISYRILNPTKVFNTFSISEEANIEKQNTTNKMQEFWLKTLIQATSLKNNYFEYALVINPVETFDFYEPRATGKYSYIPRRISSYVNFTSNQNNAFTLAITPTISKFDEQGRVLYSIYASPKYRFNTKISLDFAFDYTTKKNDRGWVAFDNDDIIFAERNREILQEDLTAKYAINNKMTINLTARYYWSCSSNHEFFTLQDDGHLLPNPTYSENKDRNFNSWNFDLYYSWWFAAGSEISFLYRNSALERTDIVETDLPNNLKNIFNSNLNHILSVSIRYSIDYNNAKNVFKN